MNSEFIFYVIVVLSRVQSVFFFYNNVDFLDYRSKHGAARV